MSEKYNVCQFFEDSNYKYVRRNCTAEEALKAFQHYTDNIATKMGITKRVIITDSGDCINMEWINGKGVVFPPPADK